MGSKISPARKAALLTSVLTELFEEVDKDTSVDESMIESITSFDEAVKIINEQSDNSEQPENKG